jgi:cyclophilin family peptidyl-prolyl cis-trans isomerase
LRLYALLALAVLVAGCGSSAAGSAKPTATSYPTWSHPPAMTISKSRHYTASVVTTDGSFTITLLPKTAPIAVNSFVFLARHHFFSQVIFHRILKGFMVQTGDPTGTGFGGPGYQFPDEKVTMKYTAGVVAMANVGPNTNGSQFFIVTSPKPAKLQPIYTIFGKVTSGMSTVYKIADTPVVQNPASNEVSEPAPGQEPRIESVTIHESA